MDFPQEIVLGKARVDDAKIKHFSAEMLQYHNLSCFIVFVLQPRTMWPTGCNKPFYFQHSKWQFLNLNVMWNWDWKTDFIASRLLIFKWKKERHGYQDSLSLANHPVALEASLVTRKMTEGWLIVTSVCGYHFIHHTGDSGFSLQYYWWSVGDITHDGWSWSGLAEHSVSTGNKNEKLGR